MAANIEEHSDNDDDGDEEEDKWSITWHVHAI